MSTYHPSGSPRWIIFSVYCMCLMCCGIPAFVSAQAPDWSWAVSVHGAEEDPISIHATDNFGNTLIGGNIYSPAIEIQDSIIVKTDDYHGNVYLAMLDVEGDIKWIKQLRSLLNGDERSVYIGPSIIDDLGNVILSGKLGGESLVVDGVEYECSGDIYTYFILKLNREGHVLWFHCFEEGVETSSIIPDNHGGFYYAGKLYWYGSEVYLGDTTISNVLGENSVFMAHFTDEFNADWAKLFLGYSTDLNLRRAEGNAFFFDGAFQINGWLDTLQIDSITLYNPGNNYYQYFFGACDIDGNVIWAKTVSDDAEYLEQLYPFKDNLYALVRYGEDGIVVEGDPLLPVPGEFNTKVMLKYDAEGQYRDHVMMPSALPSTFNVAVSRDQKMYIGFLLYSNWFTGADTLYNNYGSADPVVMIYDTLMQPLGGFNIPYTYAGANPIIEWDAFGNMLMTCAYVHDTLTFGEDVLQDFQVMGMKDHYVARSGECSTELFELSLDGSMLSAISGISWQWYLNDTLLDGANTALIFPNDTGYYRARVELDNGCNAWSAPYYIEPLSFDPTAAIELIVYPNPAPDVVSIMVSEPCDELIIYDALGQIIAVSNGAESAAFTFRSNMPGIYFVKAIKNGQTVSKKIICL